MQHGKAKKIFVVFTLLLVGLYFAPKVFPASYVSKDETEKTVSENTEETTLVETEAIEEKVATHVETPSAVKGIYITACAASTPSFRENLTKLVKETEINSVVIDIKDFSGTISIPVENEALSVGLSGKGCKIPNIEEFIKDLHEDGVYVIGRITVFQDPLYAKANPNEAIKRISDGGLWADKNGLNYLYPGSQKVWEYISTLAKESYAMGFDEINFDYIRFPSDGNIKDMKVETGEGKTKADIVESFFAFIYNDLKDTGIVTSADLFGMTTTNTDDLGIGQVLERALPYFDFICPMVYPSHYPSNFNGWSNPNAHPYDLIKFVMTSAVSRTNILKNDPLTDPEVSSRVNQLQLRPWLQNFSLGQPPYGSHEISEQIRATYESGLTSWLLWDASNKYTNTKGAVSPI